MTGEGKTGHGPWSILLRLSVTVLLLTLLVWGMRRTGQWFLLVERMGQIRPGWLAVSAAVFGASLVLSAWQWRLLLDLQGLRPPFAKVFGFYMIGQFFSNFLPSNWGGDVVRIYDIGIHNKEWERGTASVVMDRVLGFYALFVVGAVTAVAAYGTKTGPWVAVGLLAAAVLVPALFHAVDFTVWGERLRPSPKTPRWSRGPLSFLSRFLRSLGHYRGSGLLPVFVVALATQFLRIFMNLFVAWSLGLRLPFAFIFVAIPAVGILTALPVSINGIGVREMAGVWLGETLLGGGLDASGPSAMTAFFSLGYLVIVAVSLVGAVYFVVYRIRQRKERRR